MKILNSKKVNFEKTLDKLLLRRKNKIKSNSLSVIKIINHVKKNGDKAILKYEKKSSKNNNTIILYNSGNNKKIELLKKKRIILIKTNLNKRKLFDLKIIFKKLFNIGVRNLLIEGGDKITKNLIQNKLVNKFYLFRSPKMISKSKKYHIFSSLDILNRIYRKKFKINSRIGKDNITVYKK